MDEDFERRVQAEADKEAGRKIKPKKKLISELPESLQPVKWTTSRPKPDITPFWNDETREELEKYIDWHRQHPHCVTPRKTPSLDTQTKLMQDPDNPGKVFSRNGVKVAPLPAPFRPTALGAEGATDEVSSIAMRVEYDEMTNYMEQNEDPWYVMSVKDQLEQSHFDGSHTTLKYKPARKQFDKDLAWQVHSGENFEGGGVPSKGKQADFLLDYALNEKSIQMEKNPKKKRSPWATEYQFSRFTEGGTALVAFKQKEIATKVDEALRLFEKEMSAADRPHSTSRKSKKSKKSQNKQIIEKELTPIETMRKNLGGTKELDKQGMQWVKFSRQVAKKSKLQKNVIDTKMDLGEACEKLRVVKAASLLLTGQGNANMVTSDEEPIFLHMFTRAIEMDDLTFSLRLADAKNDVADRVKLQKILELLVKYGADVNNVEGKDFLGAMHHAAMSDNTKMIHWLFDNKGQLSVWSREVIPMTPLMKAAKHGNIHAIAELIRLGAEINASNSEGMTAIHFAASFGQTRAAMFLLRVGADKKLQTKTGKTAAALAQEGHFLATAQVIAAFAVPDYKAGPQLEYLVEEEKRRNATKEKSVVSKVLGNISQAIAAGAKQTMKIVGDSMRAFFKFLRKIFCRCASIDMVDEEEEENEENIEDLDQKLNDLELAIKHDPMETMPETDFENGPIVIIGDTSLNDQVVAFEDTDYIR